MIIEAFLRWNQTAAARDRAAAAGSLARAFVERKMEPDDRRGAEVALTHLLEDPSPKVRVAIAAALSASTEAPRSIVHVLARDQLEVAGHVVAFSPVLSDGDLVDLVAEGRADLQRLVALRTPLSCAVCAAIAEVGSAAAICDMLRNEGAAPAGVSMRRVAERFASVADVRDCLLDRNDLPSEVRHRLVVSVSEALQESALVRTFVGEARVARVARDACQQATLRLVQDARADELPALVEHLRMQGHLTEALLTHILCCGNVEFFAVAMASLTGQSLRRVRAIVVDGHRAAIGALLHSAGISTVATEIFLTALLCWRDAARKDSHATTATLAERLIAEYGRRAEKDEELASLLMLVERIHMGYRRSVARQDAAAMAVRAA